MYRIFSFIRHAWIAIGEPFPKITRFIRYDIVGRFWPVQTTIPTNAPEQDPLYGVRPLLRDVAVIIPCHNYGHYLREAIESVVSQTVAPIDILVVDDASDDDTADIVKDYAARGVRYLRVDYKSLALTRNAAAAATRSSFLLYVDADDSLPPDYIEKCLDAVDGPAIAIVYGDRAPFGESTATIPSPEFSAHALQRGNYISSHALIRRQAFELVGGYRQIEGSLEDWDFYRRVIAMGFTAIHADTFVHYRMHKDSMGYRLKQDPRTSYARMAALDHHPVTIFTPFAGRVAVLDRYVEALRQLEYDPTLIRLHWYNTSPDPLFDERLRTALGTLPFGRLTYCRSPLPTHWNHTPDSLIRKRIEDRTESAYYYQLAVVRAYNEMIRSCDTDFVLTVEDDMCLRPTTVLQLQSAMQADIVAVVAPYKSGFYPRYEIWDKGNDGTVIHRKVHGGSGLEDVGGSGFGCTLFRTEALESIAPLYTGVRGNPQQWYDQLTYLRLRPLGRIVCNWDAEVEHMQTERYAETLSPLFS